MNTLKNKIHNELVEVKEKKSSLVVEHRIITKRFKTILENKELFKKKNKSKLFNILTNEVHNLKSDGFSKKQINESLTDIFKSLFGSQADPVFNVWKDQGINWLITKLGIDPNEDTAKLIHKEFSNVIVSEIPELLTDCDKVTDMIVNAMSQSFQNKLSETEPSSEASRILIDTITEMIGREEFQDSVEVKIKNLVCPLLLQVSLNMVNQEKEIKNRIFSPLGENI